MMIPIPPAQEENLKQQLEKESNDIPTQPLNRQSKKKDNRVPTLALERPTDNDNMRYTYSKYRDDPDVEAHVYAFLQTWEANHVS